MRCRGALTCRSGSLVACVGEVYSGSSSIRTADLEYGIPRRYRRLTRAASRHERLLQQSEGSVKCPFFLLYRLYGGANSARSSRKLFVAYFVEP